MTLIQALESLKEKGIRKLVGLVGRTDIEDYLENAKKIHEQHVKYQDVECHRRLLENEDSHTIIETNEHYIICSNYGGLDMPSYGDYERESEMKADFKEWQIMKQANELADKKVAAGSNIPREAWVMVIAHELRESRAAASAEFERLYVNESN